MNSQLLSLKLRKGFFHTEYVLALKTFVVLLFLVLISVGNISGQKSVWRYVMTLPDGTKGYLNDEVKNTANGNKTAWEKMVSADGSFIIALSEWDCRQKRRLTKQITPYNNDQTVIGTKKKGFEWMEIIPNSTSDLMFLRICRPPQPERWAKITSEKANLRIFPDASAPVIRVAVQSENFLIVPESGEGGWYNIVDVVTQEDYWIHGDTFEIFEPIDFIKEIEKKKASPRSGKSKKKSSTLIKDQE